MRGLRPGFFVLVILSAISSSAYAQATLAGVVRDASGAVLPGVTVEAASDVLIEKVRSGVTDGTGRYQIVDLRPGTYAVSYTLTGFATVKREAVQLTGTATTTIDVEMRVGNVSETITVTGETPIVDVVNSTRQTVLGQEIVTALPTSRNSFAVGVLITGVNVRDGFGAVTDVGGATGPSTLALSAHGGKTEDQRLLLNGVALSTMIGGGWGGGAIPNASGTAEFAIDTAAVDASAATGGVRINFIPRDGGNRVAGTIAGSFANDRMQADSFVKGLPFITTPDGFRASTVKSNGEFNPGFGGPIKKDQVWFFLSGRYQAANSYVPNIYHDKNANNPTKFTYDPDLTRPGVIERDWYVYQGRLTWQASPKNKFGLTYDHENFCICSNGVSATTAPEAATEFNFPLQRFVQVDWNMPVSSNLLIEASGIHRVERWGGMDRRHGADGLPNVDPNVISIQDMFVTGLTWRAPHGAFGGPPYNNSWNTNLHYRAAVSYITGSHAFKVGFNNAWGHHENTAYTTGNYPYDISLGLSIPTPAGPLVIIPNTINLYATPYTSQIDVDADLGLFVQDKWTHNRWTVTGALRYDLFKNSYPEQTVGPSALAPGRNITFPETPNISWSDITPRLGLAYDLFGNGKTALKTSLNKYLVGLGTFSFAASNSITSARNPILTLQNSATRAWNDAFYGPGDPRTGNFIADCPAGLIASAPASGECGPISNPNFGSKVATVSPSFDPNILTGWNKRNYNWEYSLGVQQEVRPRVSVEISYFRRWYGNFLTAQNLAYQPSEFTTVNVVAPTDPGLPNGGGYTVSGVLLSPDATGRIDDQLITLSDNLPGNPKETEHWNGVDFNVIARPRNGIIAQGGVSTGRATSNYCEVIAVRPEAGTFGIGIVNAFAAPVGGLAPFLAATPTSFCDHNEGFVTQYKAFGAYTVPRADVQIAATFQNIPGPLLAANYGAPNARLVNVIEPGALYGDRLNQLDFRIGKLIRAGRTRTNVSLDFYNALNSHAVLTENSTYTLWRQPMTMLQARFFKVSAQFDF
jgi:hypothetical protein